MAYRELFVVEVREVLRLWARGHGYRSVSRLTSVDRKTVRRYVEAARALGLSRDEDSRELDDELLSEVFDAVRPGARSAPGRMREHCRAHRELIEGWQQEGCRGPKIVKLLARHTGVVVPLRTLQRFLAEEVGGSRHGDTVRVADPAPGTELQVDFLEFGFFVDRTTGKRRKLYGLLCTAGFSRHQFLWPCLKQDQDAVIEGLEAAWVFFGGVFGSVVFDNLRAVVAVADAVSPKLNAAFVEYAQARGFEIDPARTHSPRDKARVERQVRYARDDFFAGERFGRLAEWRAEAERWCREDAGGRTHGTTRKRPLEVFEAEELPALLPAPTEPYDPPVWTTVTVDRSHAVVVGYALYSVPHTVERVQLRARMDRATVKLYRGGKLVKLHPRQPEGGAHIDPADLPPGTAELATRDGASLQRRAESSGEHIGTYARRLLEGPLPWTRMRQVYRLLGLVKRYGSAAVDAACGQSLALDVVDVVRIDRMLERGLVDRGLLDVPAPTRSNVVPLRFARDPSEWKPTPTQGVPDESDAPT